MGSNKKKNEKINEEMKLLKDWMNLNGLRSFSFEEATYFSYLI